MERKSAGVDHAKVYMAVLIQEGINADGAGVIITTDPYDRENKEAIYISAKRELEIKVVEAREIAEQTTSYSQRSKPHANPPATVNTAAQFCLSTVLRIAYFSSGASARAPR
jgi:pyruvate phosphate dikinase-like enzyme